ncbi:hypothetical protein QYF61_011505, partial [Mycteria americana]
MVFGSVRFMVGLDDLKVLLQWTEDPNALAGQTGPDHALIGGIVAVVVFVTLCSIILLGRYLARHKGTYLTNEAKGAEDAPDADTAIINAEGSQVNAEEKKEKSALMSAGEDSNHPCLVYCGGAHPLDWASWLDERGRERREEAKLCTWKEHGRQDMNSNQKAELEQSAVR